MTYIEFEINLENIIEDLANKAEELGFELSADRICFDNSRAWSLYIYGDDLGLPVNKFGAYRNYLGGGVRSGICHNGREFENTVGLGELFVKALEQIESLYNSGYEDCESWEQPTGVLM